MIGRRDIRIARARHNNIRSRRAQQLLCLKGNGERNILFLHTGVSDGARVTAAMPRIDDNRVAAHRSAEHLAAVGKELDDELLMRLALRISRHRIDAEGIFVVERLQGIDAQCRALFLTLYKDEFLSNHPIERNLLRELIVNLDILQLDEELVLRMVLLGKCIGKPRRAIRLNLNTQRRASLDLRDRARNMCETHCFALCLAGSRP